MGLKLALIHNLESFPGVGVKERGGWSMCCPLWGRTTANWMSNGTTELMFNNDCGVEGRVGPFRDP